MIIITAPFTEGPQAKCFMPIFSCKYGKQYLGSIYSQGASTVGEGVSVVSVSNHLFINLPGLPPREILVEGG